MKPVLAVDQYSKWFLIVIMQKSIKFAKVIVKIKVVQFSLLVFSP